MDFAGFDWDEGNWPKCAKHGVSREEIEFVLSADALILPDRTPASDEARFNAVGRTARGRHLFVVFTLRRRRDEWLVRPISARFMHGKEVARYEQTKSA